MNYWLLWDYICFIGSLIFLTAYIYFRPFSKKENVFFISLFLVSAIWYGLCIYDSLFGIWYSLDAYFIIMGKNLISRR